MTTWVTWLYGVLAIASFFITAGMYRMGRERLVERPRTVPFRRDMYLFVLIYAGLHGLGGAIFWTLRSWDALVNGEFNMGSVPSMLVLAAVLYAVGKGGLVFASSLNGKPFVWRLFLAFAALWSGVVWWGLFY